MKQKSLKLLAFAGAIVTCTIAISRVRMVSNNDSRKDSSKRIYSIAYLKKENHTLPRQVMMLRGFCGKKIAVGKSKQIELIDGIDADSSIVICYIKDMPEKEFGELQSLSELVISGRIENKNGQLSLHDCLILSISLPGIDSLPGKE
jgi:hypothetical protein